MLGLLIGRDSYPISFDIFEGNTSEARNLLPVIKRAQQRFDLAKPTVVADSGLLSKENIKLLIAEGYEFILGAKITNRSRAVQEQIFGAAATLKDKESTVIKNPMGLASLLITPRSVKKSK
jgi:transposase